MTTLLTIGKYQYPNQVTFADALRISKTAITDFDGKMPNKDVAEALGYKIKNPNAISGYIFRKFDEICAYNLMKRQRGYLKTTALAEEALDPYDPRKAQEGKAKAIREMAIVTKAFTQWNGEIPTETAFPSKLTSLLSISWKEAQKHSEPLRKLFIEGFPYLKPVSEQISLGEETRRDTQVKDTTTVAIDIRQPHIIGELRTEEYGIIKIKDKTSIAMARMALDSLEQKMKTQKEKEPAN